MTPGRRCGDLQDITLGGAVARGRRLRPGTDESGAPVTGATVQVEGTLFHRDHRCRRPATIHGVPGGEYRVSASAPTYQTGRQPVTIVAEQLATADFVLGPSMAVALVGDYSSSIRNLLGRDGYTVTDYSTSGLQALTAAIDSYDAVVMNWRLLELLR